MLSRASRPRPAGPGAAVVALCLVQFVDVLGVTAALVAIPSMLAGVGADDTAAGPVATAYAMAFGGLLVVGARLGHRFGHLRMVMVGLAVFAVAGATGATASAAWQLVASRAAQGAASALTVPAALTLLLADAGVTGQRSRALGLWSAAGAAAGATGFFIGGVLTDLWGWRSIFWVNVPVAVALAAAVVWSVRVRPVQDEEASLDLVGAALLVGAVTSVVLGASLVQRPGWRALGAGVVLCGVVAAPFLRAWLARSSRPLVPLRLLRTPRLRIGTLGSFVNTAATSSTAVLLSLHLQRRERLTAFESGLALLSISLAVVVGSAVSSRSGRLRGPRTAALRGLVCIALGNAAVAGAMGCAGGLGTDVVVVGAVTGLLVLGAGLGLSSVAFNDIGTDLPEAEVSTATGVLNTGAQLGTALGVALLLVVAAPGSYGPVPADAVAVLGAAVLVASAACLVARQRLT